MSAMTNRPSVPSSFYLPSLPTANNSISATACTFVLPLGLWKMAFSILAWAVEAKPWKAFVGLLAGFPATGAAVWSISAN